MARDLNRFMRRYKESAIRYKSKLDFICNKYAEQNEEEEHLVVDLSSMDFLGDQTGCTDEISQHLRKLKSSKDLVSPESLKRTGSKKFPNEDADSDQWMSGGEDEDGRQFDVLKDMSNCMDKYYDSQESEPSDAETLSTMSSDSAESYSDYITGDSGEDTGSFDDDNPDEVSFGRKDYPRETLVSPIRKHIGQQEEPVTSETYVIASDKQPPYNYSGVKQSSQIEDITSSRRQAGQWEGMKNTQRRRSGYTGNQNTVSKTNGHPVDLYGDSSDSDINLREPNNNTLKSNLNYIPHERFSDKLEFTNQQILESNKVQSTNNERRRTGFTKSDVNQLDKVMGRNLYRGTLDNNLTSDKNSVSMETEAFCNDSMVVRPGSQYSSVQSYQSTSSDGGQHLISKGQWEVTGHQDFVKGLGVVHGNTGTEIYSNSPQNFRKTGNYDNRQYRRLSLEKQASHQSYDKKPSVRQSLIVRHRQLDTNASPLNACNKVGNNDKGWYETYGLTHVQRHVRKPSESPKSSPVDNVVHDSTLDICSKKDSGISSFMEDTQSSETGLKVLSVKNLKTFNESFTEKSALNVSMNHSDMETKAENENKEKIKHWLHGFPLDKSLESNYDAEFDQTDCVQGRIEHQTVYKGDENRTRTPGRETGHKRHTSGHIEKADAGCQTVTNSPRQTLLSRRSPRTSTSEHKSGKPVTDKRVIKKVARSLNNSEDIRRRSKDIGAMMRNVYGSPVKLKLMEESLPRTSSINAVKRLAEDLDYDTEWRGEYSTIGHMPTPPKSRKMTLDTGEQGQNLPVPTGKERYRVPVRHDEHINSKSARSSSDRTTSAYSDENSYVHSNDSYQRSAHCGARLSVSDPQYNSNYMRNRSLEENEDRKSFEHVRQYEVQGGTDRNDEYFEPYPEKSYKREGFETPPLRDPFDRHEVRVSSEHRTGMSKWCRGISQNENIPRSTGQCRERLQRNSDSQPVYRNDTKLPVNKLKKPVHVYKQNIQDSMEDFERINMQINRPTPRDSNEFEPCVYGYNAAMRTDGEVRSSGKYSPESQHLKTSCRDTDLQRQYCVNKNVSSERIHAEGNRSRTDSGSVRRSHIAKDLRRESGEYKPRSQYMSDHQNLQSPGFGRDTRNKYRQSVNVEDNGNENLEFTNSTCRDVYKLPRQTYQTHRRSRSRDLPDDNLQSEAFHRDSGMHGQHDFAESNNQDKHFQRRERIGRQDYVETGDLHESTNDNYGDRHDNGASGQPCYDREGIDPSFQSPRYQRNRIRCESDNTFSPSGSMARLRLSTPKAKEQFSDKPMTQYQNNIHRDGESGENTDTVYSNTSEDPLMGVSMNSREISCDPRKFNRHNSGESNRSGRFVENLSDKENEYVERDRAGFISLDEIGSLSGPVSVQRYSKSPREDKERTRNENQIINLREKTSGRESREGFITVERKSPKQQPAAVEMFSKRTSRSPRGTNNTYTLSGPARLGAGEATDVRMDSFVSSGSERYRNDGQSLSRSGSVSERYSSLSERERVSPNTSETKSGTARSRDISKHSVITQHFTGGGNMARGEAFDNFDNIDDIKENERGRNTSNRTRGDMLVRAEEQSLDYNVAHVRKMDMVKQRLAKPHIKKSLFVNSRKVSTPVNFNEFAQGIADGGMTEPMANKQASPRHVAGSLEGFKVPFSVNAPQNAVKKTVKRNLPTSKPLRSQSGYRDDMSSTLREASRRHLSEIRNRSGNFIHSTPMSSRAPLMMNETISTIQAPEETESEEVILI